MRPIFAQVLLPPSTEIPVGALRNSYPFFHTNFSADLRSVIHCQLRIHLNLIKINLHQIYFSDCSKRLGMFLRCGRVEIFLYHFNVTDGRAFGKSTDVLCLVAQSCPTLCDAIDCSRPGSSVHGDFPGKNTEVGCHALFQGIFPTQGLNQGLLHCG